MDVVVVGVFVVAGGFFCYWLVFFVVGFFVLFWFFGFFYELIL